MWMWQEQTSPLSSAGHPPLAFPSPPTTIYTQSYLILVGTNIEKATKERKNVVFMEC